MNNIDIMKVIREANRNRPTKWSILENSDTQIVLTNDYDKCIRYTITIKSDVDDEWVNEWITIRNDHMRMLVDVLLKGMPTKGCDYQETQQGITMAIHKAVRDFHCTY